MACDISKVVDLLKKDKALGDTITALIADSKVKEENKLEIEALRAELADAKAADKSSIQDEITASRKLMNNASKRIKTKVTNMKVANIELPQSKEAEANTEYPTVSEVLRSGKLSAALVIARNALFTGLEFVGVKDIDTKIDSLIDFAATGAKRLQIAIVDPLTKVVGKNALKSPHIENASNFISTMGNAVRTFYDRDIKITPDLVEFAPELAKFLEAHNGKLPEELSNTMIYALTQVLAGNKESLAGVQDNINIAEALGLEGEYLSAMDLEDLNKRGAISSSIIKAIANVIKQKVDVGYNLDKEGLGKIPIEDENGNTKTIEYDPSTDFSLRIAEALAAHLIAELVEAGVLYTSKTKLSTRTDENQIPFLKFNETFNGGYGKLLARANAANKLSQEISEVFGEDSLFDTFYTEKDTLPDNSKILKNGQPVSSKYQSTIDKIEKTYYEISDSMKSLVGMSPVELIEMFGIHPHDVSPTSYTLLGLSEEEIAVIYNMPPHGVKFASLVTTHENRVKSQVAAEGIEEIAYKGSILGKLSTITSILQLNEFLDDQLHFGAKVGSNARFYLEGNGVLTPQTDKSLRALLNTLNMKKNISTEANNEELFLFKMDVTQGLPDVYLKKGFSGEDKVNPEDTHTEFEHASSRLQAEPKTRALLKRILTGNTKKGDTKAIAAITDVKSLQALSALLALEEYLQAIEGKKESFNTQVMAQSDAKNQSVALRTMKSGSLEDAAPHLASVGVLTQTFLATLLKKHSGTQADLIQSMIDDPTKQDIEVLKDAGISIQDAYQEVTIKFLEDMAGTAMLKMLEGIFGKLVEVDSKGNTVVTPAGRNFSKHPVMIHLYGQLADSLAESLGVAAREELIKILVDSLKTKKAKGRELRDLMNNLNAAIDEALIKGNSNSPEHKRLFPMKIGKDKRTAYMRQAKGVEDDSNTEDMLQHISLIVGELLGQNLFAALSDTFAPFKEHNETITEAYNITFAVGLALNEAMLTLNNFKDNLSTPKAVLDEILNMTLGKYALKLGSKKAGGQELTISKNETDPTAYAEGKDRAIADGGTKMRVKVGKTSISYRPPKSRPKPTSTSVLPVSSHLLDANIVSKVLKYLRINQVFDAFIANGKVRLVTELLGNIAYLEETLDSKHEVESALEGVKKARKLFENNMSKELSTAFGNALTEISKKYHLDINDVGVLSTQLENLEDTLTDNLKDINTNREAKRLDVTYVSQFGVNGKLILKDGKIIALKYNVGLEPTILTADANGNHISEMSNEEIKQLVISTLLRNNDNMTGDKVKTAMRLVTKVRNKVLNDKLNTERGARLKQLDKLDGMLTTLSLNDVTTRLDSIMNTGTREDVPTIVSAPSDYAADLVVDALQEVEDKQKLAKKVREEDKKNETTKGNDSEFDPTTVKEANEMATEIEEGKTLVSFDFETNMTEKHDDISKNTPNEVYASKGHWEDGKYIEESHIHIVLAMGEDAAENDKLAGEKEANYNTSESVQEIIDGSPANGAIVAKDKADMLKQLHTFVGDHSVITFNGTDFDMKVGELNNKHYDLRTIGSSTFREKDMGSATKGKLTEYHEAFTGKVETDPDAAHSASYDVNLTAELAGEFANNIIAYKNDGTPIQQVGKITNNDYDYDGSLDEQIGDILETVEEKAKTELSSLNVIDFFTKMLQNGSKEEEISFLGATMTKLVEPILAHTEEVIDVIERETDLPYAKGHALTSVDSNADVLVIDQPRHYNGKDSSTAEVFVHEVIHPITKMLFHSKRVKHFYQKELRQIDNLFVEVRSRINNENYQDWFGKGDLAKAQYEYVFKESKGSKEFVNYLLSNHIFGNKVDMELGPIRDNLLDMPEKGGIVNAVLTILAKIINSIMGKKEKFATDLVTELILDVNGVNIKNKKVVGKTMTRTFDFLKTLDYQMKYAKMDGRFKKIKEAAATWRLIGDNVPRLSEQLADSSDFRILLADLLPSGTKDIPYVDHKIHSSIIANDREDAITQVMRKILNPTGKGRNLVNNSDDTLLKEIVVDLDLQALYEIKGITVDNIMEMMLDEEVLTKYENDLLAQIEDVYVFNEEEKVDIMRSTKDLATGMLYRKMNIGTGKDYVHINAYNIAKLHAYGKSSTASDSGIAELESLVDALATVYTLQGIPKSTKTGYATFMKEFKDVSKAILEVNNGIVKMGRENTAENRERAIKGYYTPVKEDSQYIIPIVDNIHNNITSDYKLVHQVKVNNKVTVSYYKVNRSVLQNRLQGAIGTIEYDATVTNSVLVGLSKIERTSAIRAIQRMDTAGKQESFIFLYNNKGEVRDIALRVPETLEQENLTIDNRASVTLAHAEGRYVESESTKRENDKWLDIANNDYLSNFYTNRDDFIWVGRDSLDKDLKSHYNILTDRMKNSIDKLAMSAGSKEGMWVRKSVIRLNFGGDGKSMIDILAKYDINNKDINKVVRAIEKGLLEIGKTFKLEIVGKTFDVIRDNIVSNVLLEMLKGRDPIEIIKYTMEGIVEIIKLNEAKKELIGLELEARETRNLAQASAIADKILKVNKKIDKSPVKYLDDLGFNSSFAEDVVDKDSTYMSKLEQDLYDKLDSNPALRAAKSAFDVLYINKGTKLNTALGTLFSTSDFASRYATDQLDQKYFEHDLKLEFGVWFSKKDGSEGYSAKDKMLAYKGFRAKRVKEFQETRWKGLLEQHIDYSLKAGDLLTALDRLSVLPFFKFKQRIGKVLWKRYKDNPATAAVIGSFLAYLDQAQTFGDFERAEESFFQFLSNTSGSPINHILNIMSPALLDNLGITSSPSEF